MLWQWSFRLYSKSILSTSCEREARRTINALVLEMETSQRTMPCIMSHLHSSPVGRHVFQHVYASRVAHIPLPQLDIVDSAMQLPKWRPFRTRHVRRLADTEHAVAVLASINDAARLPRVRPLRGDQCYHKNPSPMIDPLLAFYPPIILTTSNVNYLVSCDHPFTVCRNNPSLRGRPLENLCDPAWVQ